MNDVPLAQIARRMHEPSWLIMSVLGSYSVMAETQITGGVESLYAKADYPTRHLDPVTLRRELERMVADGLVRDAGMRSVETRRRDGAVRRVPRPTYQITARGLILLGRWHALQDQARRASGIVEPQAPGPSHRAGTGNEQGVRRFLA